MNLETQHDKQMAVNNTVTAIGKLPEDQRQLEYDNLGYWIINMQECAR